MKVLTKVTLALALVACISAPVFTATASAAAPTGYTNASDVQYNKSGKYVYNWGVRDETCTFLSTYARSFYTGSYVYSVLSEKQGGSGQSDGYKSALYSSLQTLMESKQTHTTSYNETREQYRYTDCEAGGGKISSFYSGKAIGPAWDSGGTWNREHTWPNSKGEGSAENDIMMLRPTSVSENSSRGNKAYGTGSGYYDPDSLGQNVRGDCARIMLYVYTRWGNTTSMWGTGGVMQNLSVMLSWMEEDPVDTWEMGRNDAVQAITGTRNVFVDYPEYAWLMFGQEVPDRMPTPSGEAKKGGTVTPDVPDSSEPESSIPELPDSSESESSVPELPDSSKPEQPESSVGKHEHEYGEWKIVREPTADKDGLKSRTCTVCGAPEAEAIPKTGNGETSSNDGGNVLFSCKSVAVSPTAIALLLGGAYVFCRKKESK